MSECRLVLGDCLDMLRTMADASADAIVTDPPAGIAFMGKAWDAQRTRGRFVDFLTPRLAECLRVARPGARMLCWALPRTSHWTGTAVEDAGWIIENKCYHLFGSGFPKAKSQLKPAVEEWVLARKPGGKVPDLNIDQCRIGMSEADADFIRRTARPNSAGKSHVGSVMNRPESPTVNIHPAGRWPASLCLSHHPACRQVGTKRVKTGIHVGRNSAGKEKFPGAYSGGLPETGTDRGYAGPDGLEAVAAWECHAECPVAELDAMSGDRPSGGRHRSPGDLKVGHRGNAFATHATMSRGPDSGGASRFFATFPGEAEALFFYAPKASRRDRGEGNSHPTVKSQPLMRWLIRLICKPGDTLIDPFVGSGSTLLAAMAEGVHAIGIEAEPEYHAIAERRIAALEAA